MRPDHVGLWHAARAKTLITSRAVLKVYGEHEFPIGPLALPSVEPLPPPESLSSYSAVQLFVERAQAVRPGLTLTTANAGAIAQICIALDGLPLAIEMAAARIKWSGPAAVPLRSGPAIGRASSWSPPRGAASLRRSMIDGQSLGVR